MWHSMLPDLCNGLNVLADLRTDGANECEQIRIANGTSKPSRGTSVARDEQQSTETLSCGLRAEAGGAFFGASTACVKKVRNAVTSEQPSLRCCCERCRLMRGAVVRKHNRRDSVSVESE